MKSFVLSIVLSLIAAFVVCVPQPSARPASRQARPPAARLIAKATVWRTSARKDRHGSYLPPWTEVKVANVFSRTKLAAGDRVTVIPLEVDLAPFNLRIVRAERRALGCDEREPEAWELELEPVRDRRLFEVAPLSNRSAEFPFDVCVISPAASSARALGRDRLARAVLPRGVPANTVTAAIDLTGDRQPEVVIAEFCCNDPSKTEPCDYTCGRTFQRVRGRWKLFDQYSPC